MFPSVFVRCNTQKELDTAIDRGYTGFFLQKDSDLIEKTKNYTVLVQDGNKLYFEGADMGDVHTIQTSDDVDKAVASRESFLFVKLVNEFVIPLENILSKSKASVYVFTESVNEVNLAFQILERGCDGVIISAEMSASDFFEKPIPICSLIPAKVTQIKPLPLCNRVCVDTCSILSEKEGMLVGSKACGLFLVSSENFPSEYVNPRPFRVNAGSIHSYLLTPEGSTKYLSEIKSGVEVMACDTQGVCRKVVTGRAKIELRPMLEITAKADGKEISVIVQNAETIRLHTPTGPKSVTKLSEGDEVLVHVGVIGRHFGTFVDETITEL